jgi:hypothetical protein
MTTLTTVEQSGEYAGQEIGRVWIVSGRTTEYWGVGSVERARELISMARLAAVPSKALREYCDAEVSS